MSPDDEQDSLLDPSQGVTSLMDMMQLVQLTKTEKSTKTRMVILQKIIQTDDIALLQKYVALPFIPLLRVSFICANSCCCYYLSFTCTTYTFSVYQDLFTTRKE